MMLLFKLASFSCFANFFFIFNFCLLSFRFRFLEFDRERLLFRTGSSSFSVFISEISLFMDSEKASIWGCGEFLAAEGGGFVWFVRVSISERALLLCFSFSFFWIKRHGPNKFWPKFKKREVEFLFPLYQLLMHPPNYLFLLDLIIWNVFFLKKIKKNLKCVWCVQIL